jgi:hypothetical protein
MIASHSNHTPWLNFCMNFWRSWDSAVDTVTYYELDILGIKSWWVRDFPDLSRLALGPTQPTTQWVPGISRGVKQPGCSVDHPPPSSTEVKERVELYLYSLSGPLWPVLGWTLPLPFTFMHFWTWYTNKLIIIHNHNFAINICTFVTHSCQKSNKNMQLWLCTWLTSMTIFVPAVACVCVNCKSAQKTYGATSGFKESYNNRQ